MSCPGSEAEGAGVWAFAERGPAGSAPVRTSTAATSRHVFMTVSSACACGSALRSAPRVHLLLQLFVGHEVPANPRRRHLVDRPLPVRDLRVRIRVERITRGVVMPH